MQSVTLKSFCNAYLHQDADGNIIGSSKPNPFMQKEMFHYNKSGEICGHSTPDFGGGYIHYDADNNIVGKSVKNPFGGYVHYDAIGNIAGRTNVDSCGNFVNYDVTLKILN